MTPSLDDKIVCLTRELRLRRRVYPNRVADGRMSAAEAERELLVMQAILSDLLDQQPDLLQASRR